MTKGPAVLSTKLKSARGDHARTRAKQRGIPPLIEQWLDRYGEEDYDGHGGCRLYFSKRSIRTMERDFGREPLRKLDEWLDVYKVEDSRSGEVITVGRRYRHLLRR
jgi:hypothetical protein